MPSITPERLREFTAALQKYKAGKASLERRVVSAENWWKLRNRFEERKNGAADDGGYRAVSGWLHNVIVSKHADAMEAFPEPVILPREPGDREEARLLSAILPCILEQNRFEKTYDAAMWQKLKTGTAAYRVVWDPEKLGGLGDIAIERVDLLNLFWEPGVADIQDSRYLFCTHLEDEDSLIERYPQLKGRLRSSPFLATRFVYDDAVSLEGKVTVIEVYYKKRIRGKTVLHYCKYVGDTVLYATEDDSFQNSEFSFQERRIAASPVCELVPRNDGKGESSAAVSASVGTTIGRPQTRDQVGQMPVGEGLCVPCGYALPVTPGRRTSARAGTSDAKLVLQGPAPTEETDPAAVGTESSPLLSASRTFPPLGESSIGRPRTMEQDGQSGRAMPVPAENGTTPAATAENYSLKTENDPGDVGIYAHGRYPFVLDPLFPVEGSPCGYGFVDLCANVQTSIDLMRTAFVKNALVAATPRYFQRIDGSVNEQEFTDLSRPLVHVSGNLGEDSLRQIGFAGLPGVYVNVLESSIRELRETSGNTETANGTMNVGVTAASAIAALQEASGKGSRDSTRSSYRAFGEIVELCIELIREFYSLPRQFRITGAMGGEDFVAFSNAGLCPRPLPGGEGLGVYQPVFDVKVSAQKRNAYSRLSQNELAMELYRLGLFQEGKELEALGLLELMEFDGREALIGRLNASLGLREKLDELQRYKALALALARRYRPDMAAGLGVPVGNSFQNSDFGFQPPATDAANVGTTIGRPQTRKQDGQMPVGEGLAPPADPVTRAGTGGASPAPTEGTGASSNSEFRTPNSELSTARASANLAPLP